MFRDWQQVLADPAVERALERLGNVESIERLDGGAVYRAWSGRRYVEFRKVYSEPPEPTLGAEVSIALHASDIMLWPLERDPPAPSRGRFRVPARLEAARPRRGRDLPSEEDDDGRPAARGRGRSAR